VTSYTGLRRPGRTGEGYDVIHRHGLSADFWDGSEHVAPYVRTPQQIAAEYRVFASMRHRFGDHIMPMCQARYMFSKCPDTNLAWFDADMQREGLKMLMQVWDLLGIGPLELLGSDTYSHDTPQVAKELGIKAIDSLVQWQNWRDGGRDTDWLINQWGAPTVPYYVAADDYRKVAESLARQNLQGFFIQWLESTGAPEFKTEYTVYRTQQGFRIRGKLTQDLATFRMPVDLRIETEGNPEEKRIEVVGPQTEFVVETFGNPKRVIVDPNSRVLRMSPQMRVSVAIRRGEQFAELGNYNEALKEYQRALEANHNSSLAHYRIAEVFFLQGNYQSAVNEFREALNGDLDPAWTRVWSHINMGKVFDVTQQRERAMNEYTQAIRTKDNTQGAQEEATRYMKEPYQRTAQP